MVCSWVYLAPRVRVKSLVPGQTHQFATKVPKGVKVFNVDEEPSKTLSSYCIGCAELSFSRGFCYFKANGVGQQRLDVLRMCCHDCTLQPQPCGLKAVLMAVLLRICKGDILFPFGQ